MLGIIFLSYVTVCEIIDCKGQYVVPGYILLLVYLYQIYNPLTFVKYAGQRRRLAII